MKQNRFFRPLQVLLLLMALSFSACIQVKENWIINRDGSGSISVRFSMNEMMGLLKMMSPAQSGPEELNSAFDTIMVKMNENIRELSSSPGISKVFLKGDPENFTFEYGFDFSGMNALNQSFSKLDAFAAALPANGPMNGLSPGSGNVLFRMEKNKFIKDFPDNFMEKLPADQKQKMEEAKKSLEMFNNMPSGTDREAEMVRMLIDKFDYTISYTFEQTINKTNNKSAFISPDRHSVVHSLELEKMFNGDLYKDFIIKLK